MHGHGGPFGGPGRPHRGPGHHRPPMGGGMYHRPPRSSGCCGCLFPVLGIAGILLAALAL